VRGSSEGRPRAMSDDDEWGEFVVAPMHVRRRSSVSLGHMAAAVAIVDSEAQHAAAPAAVAGDGDAARARGGRRSRAGSTDDSDAEEVRGGAVGVWQEDEDEANNEAVEVDTEVVASMMTPTAVMGNALKRERAAAGRDAGPAPQDSADGVGVSAGAAAQCAAAPVHEGAADSNDADAADATADATAPLEGCDASLDAGGDHNGAVNDSGDEDDDWGDFESSAVDCGNTSGLSPGMSALPRLSGLPELPPSPVTTALHDAAGDSVRVSSTEASEVPRHPDDAAAPPVSAHPREGVAAATAGVAGVLESVLPRLPAAPMQAEVSVCATSASVPSTATATDTAGAGAATPPQLPGIAALRKDRSGAGVGSAGAASSPVVGGGVGARSTGMPASRGGVGVAPTIRLPHDCRSMLVAYSDWRPCDPLPRLQRPPPPSGPLPLPSAAVPVMPMATPMTAAVQPPPPPPAAVLRK
jgi:hypothetical protein